MSDYHGGEVEEGPVSITTDVIDSLHRQLSAIEQVVHGMEDHLAECHRAIENNKEQGILGMHVRGKTDIVDGYSIVHAVSLDKVKVVDFSSRTISLLACD